MPRGKIDHVLCIGLHSSLKVINIVIVGHSRRNEYEAGLDSRAFPLHSGHLASGAWGGVGGAEGRQRSIQERTLV